MIANGIRPRSAEAPGRGGGRGRGSRGGRTRVGGGVSRSASAGKRRGIGTPSKIKQQLSPLEELLADDVRDLTRVYLPFLVLFV